MSEEMVWIALLLYLIPAMVGYGREHHSKLAILMVNLLLGWTVVGWLIALIWACTNPKSGATVVVHNNSPTAPNITDELEKLAALKDRGVLTQEEFNTRKQQILS